MLTTRFVFNGSLALVIIGGVVIILISQLTGIQKRSRERMLCERLWSGYIPDELRVNESDRIWAWRKMILAGFMLSSFLTSLLVKRYGGYLALTVGLAVFVIWLLLFLTLWAACLSPWADRGIDEGYRSHRKDIKRSAIPDGWSTRTKSKSAGDRRLPVTILTGYLGSGKTTLIKHILSNTIGMKVLVVENEIGSEGIDHELLMQHTVKEEVILLKNGCVCCSVRKDLLSAFHKLLNDDLFAKLDWVVIETTGLADPVPLIQSLYMDDRCKAAMRLDAVLTVVDAVNFRRHVTDISEAIIGVHGGASEAVQQVLHSDLILLNKTDLVSSTDIDAIQLLLRRLNPEAKLLPSCRADVPIDSILNIRAFDPRTNKALLASKEKVQSSFLPIDSAGNLEPSRRTTNSKPTGITSDKMSGGLMTVSISCDDAIDLSSFNIWISQLLNINGANIYRLKGILHMSGKDEQFMCHGIHMLFEGEIGAPWPEGIQRKSKIVIIGLHLSPATLQKDFIACRSPH